MSSLHKTAASCLHKTILFTYKFGFAGEVYIPEDRFENDYHPYENILKKYYSYKKPFYCNRNSAYYSTDLSETMELAACIPPDASVILNSEISRENKRYIIFSLTGYMLSCIAKILGISFSYNALKNGYYEALKAYLLRLTDYMAGIICNEDIKGFPLISESLMHSLVSDMHSLGISKVREYSEMDHILILFITYFVFSDFITMHDIIISPLQGAAFIPPLYISMQKYINRMESKPGATDFEYVRFSRYDHAHYCQSPLSEQVQALTNRYPDTAKIILIDDNTGTAMTIKAIKQELSKYFKNITTGVLEYYWDAKIFKADTYPAFQFNDIDLVTPLCYRHFKVLDEQIDYIKSGRELHQRYCGGKFNRLHMIYDEMDYRAYINSNCADKAIQSRILTVYEKFRHIVEAMRSADA